MKSESQTLSIERLHLVQRALALGEPREAIPRLPPGIEIVARKSFLAPAAPAGFLAAFNAHRGGPVVPGGPPPVFHPDVDGIFLLKQGLNRIGFDGNFGDFERPAFRSMESRQWLILVAGTRAFVTDDLSENGSFVLPRDAARLAGGDPRFDVDCTGFGRQKNARIALDWESTRVVELHEGDVLISCYSAFVFGWLRPVPSEDAS